MEIRGDEMRIKFPFKFDKEKVEKGKVSKMLDEMEECKMITWKRSRVLQFKKNGKGKE